MDVKIQRLCTSYMDTSSSKCYRMQNGIKEKIDGRIREFPTNYEKENMGTVSWSREQGDILFS